MVENLVESLNLFIAQVLMFVPRLIFAYVLWLIGDWLIDKAVQALDLLDVKQWKIDDRIRNTFKRIFVPAAKVVLILIILDTLGIGSNIIAAVANGITFTIAIALGLAFGRALENDARYIVEQAKNSVSK